MTTNTNDKINAFLDRLIKQFGLKNDAELCRCLGLKAPMMSKLRHGVVSFSSRMILAVHEVFNIPVAEIRRSIAP